MNDQIQSICLDGHQDSVCGVAFNYTGEYVATVDDKISKNTIIRDLDVLLKNNYIKKTGAARSIKYLPAEVNELLVKYDVDNYFKGDFDDPFEKEANIFASEILMLSKAVLRLAGSKVSRTECDLAVLFNVSIEAVDWKLRYLKIID